MVRNRLVFGLVPFLAVLIAGCASATPAPDPTALPTEAPPTAPTATSPAAEPTAILEPEAGILRLVIAPQGNQARFSVREQLVNLTLPNDAVGTTAAVSGVIVVQLDGQVIPEGSRFVVDMTTLATDSSRRDSYIHRSTLETGTYPEAVFVPAAAAGLPSPLPDSGPVAFQLSGDLIVHGVTRPVTWEVTAEIAGQSLTGTATTSITFTDFGMTLPRVGPVLSVEDLIALQLDFVLTLE
jgi:polyisoprenoid-binding protein YceI